MRCFIGIDLDPQLKEKVLRIQKDISRLGDVKLVEPENLHFTLKFIGEVTETADIEKDTDEKLSPFQPFDIYVKSMGVFPNEDFIRVVWIGTQGLSELQRAFSAEKPHLTIARVRSPRGKDKLLDYVNKHKTTDFGVMTVYQIKLKKSTLTPRGPVYEDIRIFELGDG